VDNSKEALYQGERYGNFSYRIPLAPGKYRLTLHFAETWFGVNSPEPALGSRIFNVFANGVALLRDFQVARDAGGPNRSLEKVFQNLEPNAQGMLVLDFVPIRNYAEVNAIEVVQTE
jgi:Malectin domain